MERIRLTGRYEGGGARVGTIENHFHPVLGARKEKEYFHSARRNMIGWANLYELCKLVADRMWAAPQSVRMSPSGDSCSDWLDARSHSCVAHHEARFGHASVEMNHRRFPQGGISLGRLTLRCHYEIGNFGCRGTCLVARLSRFLFSQL